MGKAADEPVLPLHGGLQGCDVLLLPGGHGVKLPGQGADLIGRGDSRPAGQVPGGQLLGRVGELVQRPGEDPGNGIGEPCIDGKQKEKNPPMGLLLLLPGLVDGGDVVGHVEEQRLPLDLQLPRELQIVPPLVGEGGLGIVGRVHQTAEIQKPFGDGALGEEGLLVGLQGEGGPGLVPLGGELGDGLGRILRAGPDLHRFHHLQGAEEQVIGGPGGCLLPGQGGLEGQGDQRAAAHPKQQGDQADHAQGGFPTEAHGSASSR